MHGITIAIEDDFFKKGDTVTGANGSEMKLDYSDVGAPPLHANCRCYSRPDEIEVNFDEGKAQKGDDGDNLVDGLLKIFNEK